MHFISKVQARGAEQARFNVRPLAVVGALTRTWTIRQNRKWKVCSSNLWTVCGLPLTWVTSLILLSLWGLSVLISAERMLI